MESFYGKFLVYGKTRKNQEKLYKMIGQLTNLHIKGYYKIERGRENEGK